MYVILQFFQINQTCVGLVENWESFNDATYYLENFKNKKIVGSKARDY